MGGQCNKNRARVSSEDTGKEVADLLMLQRLAERLKNAAVISRKA